MVGNGIVKISTVKGTILDNSDLVVGGAGLTTALVAKITGYTIPGVGEFVALYSWGRFWFDLGQDYGPSTWYGKDDNKWLK